MLKKKNMTSSVEQEQIRTYDSMTNIPADAFEVIGTDADSMETIVRPSTSFWKDAWNRIRKSKVAVICMIILFLLLLGSIFIPMFSPLCKSTVIF